MMPSTGTAMLRQRPSGGFDITARCLAPSSREREDMPMSSRRKALIWAQFHNADPCDYPGEAVLGPRVQRFDKRGRPEAPSLEDLGL